MMGASVKKEDLRVRIAAAREAMQQPALKKFKRMNLADLRRAWRETCRAAKAAGLVE